MESWQIVTIILGCLLSLFVLAGCLGWALAKLLWIPVPRKLPGRDDKTKLWSYMWLIKKCKVKSYFWSKLSWRQHRVTMIRNYLNRYCGPKDRPVISRTDPELKVKMHTFNGVPVKVYTPITKTNDGMRAGMVYLHGGCWSFGSADYMDGLTALLSKKCNMIIASVNYRLAPEYPYPTPLEDCVSATKYFLLNAVDEFNVDPKRIVIGGDSAGGNLAAATALKLRDENFTPRLKMQVLIYPMLQGIDFFLESHDINDDNPYLDRKFIISCYLWYAVGNDRLLKKVLKKQHLSPALREKMVQYVNKSLMPVEKIEPIRPNKEVLKKGKQAMIDETATRDEKEPLLGDDMTNAMFRAMTVNPFLDVKPIALVDTTDELNDKNKTEEKLKEKGDKEDKEKNEEKPVDKPVDKSDSAHNTSNTPKNKERKFSFGSKLEVPKEHFNIPNSPPITENKNPLEMIPGVEIITQNIKDSGDQGDTKPILDVSPKEASVLVAPGEIESIFTDPYFSPLLAPDLSNLPFTYLLTCEHDVVKDECFMYRTRLEKAGVKVEHVHYMANHALLDSVVDVTYARYALDCMAEFLKRHV